jgi:hypothetical protein
VPKRLQDVPLWNLLRAPEVFDELDNFSRAIEREIDHLLTGQHESVRSAETEDESERELMVLDMMRTFPRHLRYAVLLSTWGTVDATLIEVCDFVRRLKVLPSAVHELRGSSLERYAQYLDRSLGVKIKQKAFWSEMENLMRVRNCIAHVGGYLRIDRNRPRTQTALTALDLTVGRGQYIKVSKEVLPRLILFAKGWLREVVGDVDSVTRR